MSKAGATDTRPSTSHRPKEALPSDLWPANEKNELRQKKAADAAALPKSTPCQSRVAGVVRSRIPLRRSGGATHPGRRFLSSLLSWPSNERGTGQSPASPAPRVEKQNPPTSTTVARLRAQPQYPESRR